MQEIVRINELLEISAFFQKREIVQKECVTVNLPKLGCARKGHATFNKVVDVEADALASH